MFQGIFIKREKLFLNTNKIKGKFFRVFGIHLSLFVLDVISIVQPRYGDEAATSLCR